MYSRFKDAVAIQGGACNPIAIANALVKAITACRAENMGTDAINADPAVRMIVHQLAHLTKVGEFHMTMDVYAQLTAICEAEAAKV